MPGELYNGSTRKGEAGWTGLSSADRFPRAGWGAGASSPSERRSPPGPAEQKQPSPINPRLPPPPASTPGLEAQSKQVSEAGHRGTLFAPAALTSVCERAPGEGRLARGPRGDRRGGQRRPRPERAEAGRERVFGRRVRAGSSAAAPRPDTAPRLGASSCSAAAASSRAASAGRLLGLSQHFPAVSHTPLFERGLSHTRTHPQTARSLRKKKIGNQSERGGGGKSLTEVRRLGSPFEASGGRRRREANSVCQAKPLSPPSAGPERHPSRRPCGLGREAAATPPHISDLRPGLSGGCCPKEGWRRRLGLGEGRRSREEPRYTQQRRGDAPQQSQGILCFFRFLWTAAYTLKLTLHNVVMNPWLQ
ncbi:transcription factor SOX-30-like [Symphalangus syndactylus]|uniref:transcription factor SOX-30-like n=1 Tax=Symphalangus syndactylus TaxID=9590 RepID=UPI003007BF6A